MSRQSGSRVKSIVSNLAVDPKSSVGKKRFQQHTLAMAIGLSDHVWTKAQILRTPVYPESKI